MIINNTTHQSFGAYDINHKWMKTVAEVLRTNPLARKGGLIATKDYKVIFRVTENGDVFIQPKTGKITQIKGQGGMSNKIKYAFEKIADEYHEIAENYKPL